MHRHKLSVVALAVISNLTEIVNTEKIFSLNFTESSVNHGCNDIFVFFTIIL